MERWDLYDTDRAKTNVTILRGERVPEGLRHLVVYACVFRPDGRLLVQRRQLTKRGNPGMWDLTVGGSAIAGESSREAIAREAREELGLTLALDGALPALTHYIERCIVDTYVVTQDAALSALTLQQEEVMDAKWATKDEVLAMIDGGAFVPYHRGFIELVFFLRTHRGVVLPRGDEQ